MSNGKKIGPRPPESVAALAASYRCGHCNSETGRPFRDELGVWHVSVYHDESCPARAGRVPLAPQGIRAVAKAVADTGQPILYITDEESS